ncbi:TPA: hypothetical protein HA372_00140 [Candidatus Woesearchaeota archaeon]|nr:MAG: hypothetical protein QT04_C0037G0010 [archaeon GW2011_AR11]HIH05121.1 hypothetical protein [Candidatus Woesearchaeota archaeon]HII64650.1 hypothetical protein [Candidatus Woesearchaeota archaeon]HIJ18085.1 hypothetical protein [Candidatus Woesearchaeota archaeon]
MAKKEQKQGKDISEDGPVIVKRGAHAEEYDERKVYASVYFSCRNAHLSEQEAEAIAEKVAPVITGQAKKEKIILSDRILRLITGELRKYSEDAAFLYETHRDLS